MRYLLAVTNSAKVTVTVRFHMQGNLLRCITILPSLRLVLLTKARVPCTIISYLFYVWTNVVDSNLYMTIFIHAY